LQAGRRRLRSGFEAEIFDRSRARSAALTPYFQVYLQYLAPEHRTKTNELLEFLEKPCPGQIIVYFGLNYRGKPCGVATLMMYPASNIAIIDHIAIAPTERHAGAFYAFCEYIADYLERLERPLNYVIAEVVLSEQPVTTGLNALMLIRLTRFIGFKVVSLPYYAPDPSFVDDRETSRAALVMFSQPERSALDAPEMIKILRTIFFDHYTAWYRRMMRPDQFSKYEKAVTDEFDRLARVVKNAGGVKVNGMRNFDLPYILSRQSEDRPRALGAIILVAIPSAITVTLAFAQEPKLAMWASIATVGVFALVLVPRFRRIVLRFFQQEE
jgi:hypothetical protein